MRIRRKRETSVCTCMCVRKEYESTWFRRRRVKEKEEKKRKRRRRRFRFRPSGNRTRSSPFLVFDPHQILLSSRPDHHRVLFLYFAGPHPASFYPLAILTLSVYMYYAKQVIVGGLGSQAYCVINTDALVVSLSFLSSSLHLFIFSLSASCF